MIEIKHYAGLIRNHAQLASELGICTNGMSKDERERALIVAAYEAWGTNMGTHINGQFGIALYDTERKQTFCTRDVLGAELFFYYLCEDGSLLCGNDIKELFTQPGFCKELNTDMLQFYLGFTYLPGEETLFKGVMKLAPGGYLLHDATGVRMGTYWELSFEPDETKTLDQWADDIYEAMGKSFEDIIDPDQSPDSFLSGGVDSSFILARSNAKTGYCAAYENQQASEESEARATAQLLGRNFEAITVSPEEFLANVDEFLLAYEIPTADVAGLSLYCAAKRLVGTSEVCFSGEGADEFFAGYSVYRAKPWWRKLFEPHYYGTTYIMNEHEQQRFVKCYNPNKTTTRFIEERIAPIQGKGYDELASKLYTDMRTYFEGSILYNSTKISRGTGLDIRMPFCDLRVFDIARRLPSRFKYTTEGNKIALRAAASKLLPAEIAYRKKLGFPVPVRAWLQRPEFHSEIHRALTSACAQKFFNNAELEALLDAFEGRQPKIHRLWYKRHESLLWRYVWTLYTFVRWYELFFEDALNTNTGTEK